MINEFNTFQPQENLNHNLSDLHLEQPNSDLKDRKEANNDLPFEANRLDESVVFTMGETKNIAQESAISQDNMIQNLIVTPGSKGDNRESNDFHELLGSILETSTNAYMDMSSRLTQCQMFRLK